jgi:hypothetical protein
MDTRLLSPPGKRLKAFHFAASSGGVIVVADA